jgi:calcium-dependent protein kinase
MGNDIKKENKSSSNENLPNAPVFIYHGEIKGTKLQMEPLRKKTSSPKKIKTVSGSLNSDIRKKYKFKEVLGGGNFGSVRVAYRKDDPLKQNFAVKSISKKNLSDQDLNDMIKEVEIISNLHHPIIIKFYETYQDKYYFHIVMELCTGKDLFSKIVQDGKISEHYVAEIIMKILSAITYCHSKQITHRDIKPENILFLTKEPNSGIKLIDFGLSKKFNHKEKMHSILGTPYYIAPEVLKGDYDCKCDIWSIGSITYMMLCGSPVFNGQSDSEIFDKIINQPINFPKEKFDKISSNAIDFMKKCLVKDPSKRISAKEGLLHPWFKYQLEKIHSEEFLDNEILNNLKNFTSPINFKKLVLKYLVNMVNDSELKKLKQTFVAIDRDHTGCINLKELETAFQMLNIEISNKDIHKIYEAASEQNGVIDYNQFLIASMNQKKNLKKEQLIQAFKYFDIDDSGYIDKSDIQNAALRSGKKFVNENDIDNMMKEVKVDNKGKISLDEFLKLFGINE